MPDDVAFLDNVLSDLRKSDRSFSDLITDSYIDNDVRCVTRGALSQYRKSGGWENFVCIYVAGGVGAGLVMDRSLYYGSHGAAGEIGHASLNCISSATQPRFGSIPSDLPRCSCGTASAIHWEQLVTYEGLEALAAMRNIDGTMNKSAPVPANAPDNQGFTSFATTDSRLGATASEYRDGVIDDYLHNLAIGVGAIVNALDVSYVVLCGELLEEFSSKGLFDALPSKLQTNVVRPQQPKIVYGSVREWGWRGAALLAWDPALHAKRRGRSKRLKRSLKDRENKAG